MLLKYHPDLVQLLLLYLPCGLLVADAGQVLTSQDLAAVRIPHRRGVNLEKSSTRNLLISTDEMR